MDLARLSDISLPDQHGTPHRLGDLWADHTVVLVFRKHTPRVQVWDVTAGKDLPSPPELEGDDPIIGLDGQSLVAMLGDRSYGSPAVRVPFLGGTASFPVGAYVLAALAGAPLVQVFSLRETGGHYRFFGFPPLPPLHPRKRTSQTSTHLSPISSAPGSPTARHPPQSTSACISATRSGPARRQRWGP